MDARNRTNGERRRRGKSRNGEVTDETINYALEGPSVSENLTNRMIPHDSPSGKTSSHSTVASGNCSSHPSSSYMIFSMNSYICMGLYPPVFVSQTETENSTSGLTLDFFGSWSDEKTNDRLDIIGILLRVWAPHLQKNVCSTKIRDSLRHILVKPKHLVRIPYVEVTFWSKSRGIERPDHLDVSCFASDLRYRILRKKTVIYQHEMTRVRPSAGAHLMFCTRTMNECSHLETNLPNTCVSAQEER